MTVDKTTKEPEGTVHQIKQICVSDDKKVVCIDSNCKIGNY